jgi:MoxR-like ATPase
VFESVEEVERSFSEQGYITDRKVATVVYLACQLQKPLLVEGPAGVGKTELAKVMAKGLQAELIRLQCYEGLDEAKAIYEWEYGKQMLYTQMLKEKIGEVLADAADLATAVDRIAATDEVFFSERFLLPRPILRSVTTQNASLLLIDEVDKSDSEFEAFLLEVLSEYQVTVPEIGTITADVIPFAVLTSNNTRELSDALKRRCLHLYLDFPEPEREAKIILAKVPHAGEKLAAEIIEFVNRLRKVDLKKLPSISETIDWARALTLLNAETLGDEVVEQTINVLLKYEADIRKAESAWEKLKQDKQAPPETEAG